MVPLLPPDMFRTAKACASSGCVEIDTDFVASSFCANSSRVEVKRDERVVAVRDSKDLHSPILTFGADEWRDLVTGIKNGEFDL